MGKTLNDINGKTIQRFKTTKKQEIMTETVTQGVWVLEQKQEGDGHETGTLSISLQVSLIRTS
jgi:hypothetical protein